MTSSGKGAITAAQQKSIVRDVVAVMADGVERSKYDVLDRGRIAKVNELTEKVNVSLQRWESQGLWTHARKFTDAGTYYNVETLALMDSAGWIFGKAGGGDYTVELIHPTEPSVGVLYGFKINVPGVSRTPEAIRQAAAQVQGTDQDLTGKLAATYIKAGMAPQAAYELAAANVKANPGAAQMAVQAQSAPEEEDEMSLMMRYMLMDKMMSAQNSKPNGEHSSKEIAELKAQLLAQQAEARAAEERRRLEEQHSREMAALRDQMREMRAAMEKAAAAAATPKQDTMVALAAALAPIASALITNQQAQRNSEVQASAEQFKAQIEFMRGLAEQSRAQGDAKAKETEVMSNALMGMMQHQLALAKAKSEEPIQQIQAVQGMAAAMGGILNGYAQLAQALTHDDTPAWLRPIQQGMAELPGMVMALLGGPSGGTPPPDAYDASDVPPPTVDEQVAAAAIPPDEHAEAVAAGTAPPEQVQAPQTPPPPQDLQLADYEPADRKLIKEAMAAIDVEDLKPYLCQPRWLPILLKIKIGGDPRMIGRRIAELVVSDHEAGILPPIAQPILADPAMFGDLLESTFKLKHEYVEAILAGFREWLDDNGIEITVPEVTDEPVPEDAVKQ